jgi:fatty acid-binding protein DegV
MSKYQIFTDSCSDLSKEIRTKAGIEYFRMGFNVGDKLYPADMDFELYTPEQLYAWIGDLKNH